MGLFSHVSIASSAFARPGETEGLVAAAQREEQKMQGANFPVIGQSRQGLGLRLPAGLLEKMVCFYIYDPQNVRLLADFFEQNVFLEPQKWPFQ